MHIKQVWVLRLRRAKHVTMFPDKFCAARLTKGLLDARDYHPFFCLHEPLTRLYLTPTVEAWKLLTDSYLGSFALFLLLRDWKQFADHLFRTKRCLPIPSEQIKNSFVAHTAIIFVQCTVRTRPSEEASFLLKPSVKMVKERRGRGFKKRSKSKNCANQISRTSKVQSTQAINRNQKRSHEFSVISWTQSLHLASFRCHQYILSCV